MSTIVSAPAKIILSGEHAAVHGYPALAGALSLRLTITTQMGRQKVPAPKTADEAISLLQAKVQSEIPQGSGLGSSAALSVSAAGAWLSSQKSLPTKEEIFELAHQFEQHYHTPSSGIDTAISTFGGLLWFRRETQNLVVRQSLPLEHAPKFAILHSGKPNESTAELIALVRERLRARPQNTRALFQNIENCTRSFVDALLTKNFSSLGEIIDENGVLLEKLGVASVQTKKLCRQLRSLGLHCKVSGAGGAAKGSGVILVYAENAKEYEILKKFPYSWQEVSFSPEGVIMKETE